MERGVADVQLLLACHVTPPFPLDAAPSAAEPRSFIPLPTSAPSAPPLSPIALHARQHLDAATTNLACRVPRGAAREPDNRGDALRFRQGDRVAVRHNEEG